MLDTVAMERLGIPAIAIAHDLFESAAKAGARSQGMPDLPIVVTPRPRQGSDTDEMLEVDSTLVDRVISALEQRMQYHAEGLDQVAR
jgi:hypothetical protein